MSLEQWTMQNLLGFTIDPSLSKTLHKERRPSGCSWTSHGTLTPSPYGRCRSYQWGNTCSWKKWKSNGAAIDDAAIQGVKLVWWVLWRYRRSSLLVYSTSYPCALLVHHLLRLAEHPWPTHLLYRMECRFVWPLVVATKNLHSTFWNYQRYVWWGSCKTSLKGLILMFILAVLVERWVSIKFRSRFFCQTRRQSLYPLG